MPYLYCEKHGREHEAGIIERQGEHRRDDDIVLVVNGTLASGPWQCDRCNARLRKGDRAVLLSAFPGHCREELYDYDFGYERQYFAMNRGDTATAYGADWPDDSLRNRRVSRPVRPRREPVCALDIQPGE